MRRTPTRGLFVASAATALLAGSLGVAQAAPSTTPLDDVDGADKYTPGLIRAMERDLGLSPERAVERLDFQAEAADTSAAAAKTLDSFAGSWVDPVDDIVYVAVTDTAERRAARALGAVAVASEHSADDLDSWKAALDDELLEGDAAGLDKGDAPSWYIDPTSNDIVVGVAKGAREAVKDAVAEAGVPASAVRYTTEETPRTFVDVVGGNAYTIGGTSRCSVGFTVGDGFVTAGHCGDTGATTSGPTGTFVGSSFPGNDYAYVRVAAGNNLIGAVNNYSGARVSVAGSTPAAVGASVCRSGSTTGWHCGTIQAFNATVNYSEGSVSGLIRTTVCAEPGDSGGSLVAGNQAQGVTSGGSGNCSSGGTTYFQPVNEALAAYGVSLRTGGGTTTPPPATGCSGLEQTRTGTLSTGQSSATTAFTAAAGTFRGCLDGPSGTDFDLALQKQSSGTWRTVAQGVTAAADETVTYSGTSGTYRWVVTAYSGSGSFTLGFDTP
jgi:streptogrisin C